MNSGILSISLSISTSNISNSNIVYRYWKYIHTQCGRLLPHFIEKSPAGKLIENLDLGPQFWFHALPSSFRPGFLLVSSFGSWLWSFRSDAYSVNSLGGGVLDFWKQLTFLQIFPSFFQVFFSFFLEIMMRRDIYSKKIKGVKLPPPPSPTVLYTQLLLI